MTQQFTILKAAAILSSLLIATAAYAGNGNSGKGNGGNGGGNAGGAPALTWITIADGYHFDGSHTLSFTPDSNVTVLWHDGNITPQDPANIRNVVDAAFGLTGSHALGSAVSICDNANCNVGSGNDTVLHAIALTPTHGFSNAYESTVAIDYLAVHIGQGELLFHWTNKLAANTEFEIGGLPHGLSNYRAFASAVPEPETYGMLLAGLGLVGFAARRRNVK